MTCRRGGWPGERIAEFDGIDDRLGGISQLDPFATVTEAAFEITDDGGVRPVVRDECAAVPGDDDESARGKGDGVGERELNAFDQGPSGQIHRLLPGVMEFEPLQFIPVVGRVVHDLVDHDLGVRSGSVDGEEAEDQ